jgi:hypothetical protein
LRVEPSVASRQWASKRRYGTTADHAEVSPVSKPS